MDKQEMVKRMDAVVKLIRQSGSTDAKKACTARASAIAEMLVLIKDLNSQPA